MSHMEVSTRCPAPKCVCASEHAKLICALDGTFPDFGHHSEGEMGGLWMHPIKVLDGFWLRFRDTGAERVDGWTLADGYSCRPEGNSFTYAGGMGHTRMVITREQLAPDSVPGLVVTYRFENTGLTPCQAEAEWLARTELFPVWYSQEAGVCQDGPDEGAWEAAQGVFHAWDARNPWHALIGCETPPDSVRVGQFFGPQVTRGQGVSFSAAYAFTVPPHQARTLRFFITSSPQSQAEARDRLAALRAGADLAGEKRRRYAEIFRRSRLAAPDPRLNQVWDWVKANTDWLAVNAGPYGRALGAGLPEYPWWFGCDSCYAVQGLLAMGEFALARDTLKLLADYSEKVNGDGRIVHEITTFGACSNPGNTQETAHFVTALWHYWRWTGDRTLMDETLPLARKAMDWLEAQDADGDLFPSGYGIIEIAGLNAEMIDTIVYTAQAWQAYGALCRLAGQEAEARRGEEMFRRTWAALNERMWDEEAGLYCDAYASPDFVRSRREDVLGRYHKPRIGAAERFDAMFARKTGPGDQETGFLINGNWTLFTPMETGLAPEAQAQRALARMTEADFVGPWGVYLNALDQGAIMTISTGAGAVAQARYGHGDRALDLLTRMIAAFGMASPGTLSEMSPDYGCFCQAWTAYALFVPVVRHFFGIQPEAGAGCVMLTPCMPGAWPQAALTGVRVLDGEMDVAYARGDAGYDLTLTGRGCPPVRLALRPGETPWGADGRPLDASRPIPLPEGQAVRVHVKIQAERKEG